MAIIFFTGFPGFLGSELLPRVLRRSPEDRAVCLVQAKFLAEARARLEGIESEQPDLRGRTELATGDITLADLGLARAAAIRAETCAIFHLAAVYDLGAAADVATRVNVEGTRQVLAFAEAAPNLRRMHYVSTCYVSGSHPGVFTEDDLEKGQSFHNHYERSKYEAEVEVQARMRAGLPVTVYRPSIVMGDSRTGATQKYDGPYCVIRWLLRQPRLAVLPSPGDPTATRVNIVPRDYVVEALSYLSGLETTVGRVYHLCDPAPLNVAELIDLLGRIARRRIMRIRVPLGLAKFAIDHVPGVYRYMQTPSAAIDYFAHPTHYTCDGALAALAGSGLKPPPLASYLDRLVEFVREHRDIPSGAMA